MHTLAKALWYIESHYAENLSLGDIAHVGGASPCHLTRAFGLATGHSVMRYVRARRLSEAARALAQGAQDILAVAVEAGYSSHEAFTRAFRDQFHVTPEKVRAQRHVANLALVDAIKMDVAPGVPLEAPRFEQGPALLVAGLAERYRAETAAGIPALWQRFLPHVAPGQLVYGVCCNNDDAGNFDYLCAMPVSDFSQAPDGWTRLRIAPQRYAVFHHRRHISTIRTTWHAVWNEWLPQSGLEVADAPDFERYNQNFDPASGNGGVEIWLPLKA
ncbi:Right origin-binding protein [Janthinobacterium sp. KBS0711]|uniref:AraC family transcriptional regulator n=1 Tax=Janthinobacterium sp. KBS0711 TaxID=1649647 RepID=UPI00062766EB|nr:AraC family transcriptional regulator [Janthinobacterium sp. KBS0711]KKO62348.1 Right origin-binding protein [Janthinobacterium sp. KBS0711]TSD70842.1 AraC family transcriptional regulator [Janthinobacterium sp. KBS0711]